MVMWKLNRFGASFLRSSSRFTRFARFSVSFASKIKMQDRGTLLLGLGALSREDRVNIGDPSFSFSFLRPTGVVASGRRRGRGCRYCRASKTRTNKLASGNDVEMTRRHARKCDFCVTGLTGGLIFERRK